MNSKHLVDPELAPILDILPVVPLNNETLAQARASQKAMVAASKPAPSPDIEVTEYLVPGPQDAPQVRVLLYLPKELPLPLPALLWVPAVVFAALAALPFLDRSPYRSPRRRRLVMAIGALAAIAAVLLVLYALVTVPVAHVQGAMG